MLDQNELAMALDLHSKSYRLLLWLSDNARDNRQLATVAHDSLSTGEAAVEWLTRLYGSLPPSTRPENRDIDAYALFFSTYLTTSFDVNASKSRVVSSCGCYCSYCRYVVSAQFLKPKRVGARDKKRAIRLMEDRVIELAYEEGVSRPDADLYALLDDSSVRESAAWSTYGQWLIRRSRGWSDGVSVLALWRMISASNNARSDEGRRRLQLQDFVEAEENLAVVISRFSGRFSDSV